MELTRRDEGQAVAGSPDYFTGEVRLTGRFARAAPARVSGATVSFAPGARTAWHAHPLGQTLVVIAGEGRAQAAGGPVRVIAAGDVVWFAPGERHWHGAAPDRAMTHVAIAEARDGVSVEWLEQVAEADYLAPPAPQGG